MEDCQVGSQDMHSPSLKRLTIRHCTFSDDRTRMSFPSLVSFEFIDTKRATVRLLEFESMLSLETATVRCSGCNEGPWDDCGDEDDDCYVCSYYYIPSGGHNCVFLEGLTEATYLNLSAYPRMYVFNRDLQRCPPFSKLKTLVLEQLFISAELSALIWFLHHTPLLENLTLIPSKVCNNLMTMGDIYKPSEKSSASCHLKLVEIICENVDKAVLKILKVLNANGIPLGKISIQCYEGFSFACTDVSSK